MIIMSAFQYFHCALSNMMRFEGPGITPINISTQADAKHNRLIQEDHLFYCIITSDKVKNNNCNTPPII